MTEEVTLADLKRAIGNGFSVGAIPKGMEPQIQKLGLAGVLKDIHEELKAIRKLLENIASPFEMYGPEPPEEE